MKTVRFFLLALASIALFVPQSAQAQNQNLVEVAVSNDNFSTLVAAVKAADLVETLSGEGPFTVFAPTNDAFSDLPNGLVEALLQPENKSVLQQILTYHVVPGKLLAADVAQGISANNGMLTATTASGGDFTVMRAWEDIRIQDGQNNMANIVATDIIGTNGVIHIIDRVILPKGLNVAALLPSNNGHHRRTRRSSSNCH
ncbi:MAG: fasciclin domain-containing protein [Bacteroidota bacterium]